jgi:hypothetical protein
LGGVEAKAGEPEATSESEADSDDEDESIVHGAKRGRKFVGIMSDSPIKSQKTAFLFPYETPKSASDLYRDKPGALLPTNLRTNEGAGKDGL